MGAAEVTEREHADAAERLLFGSRLPVRSTEDRALAEPWMPSRPIAAARGLLRGLETLSTSEAADRLALAAGQLLSAAREAWWPIQMQGELEVSADEMPQLVQSELGFADAAGPAPPDRLPLRELRRAVETLADAADKLERANPESVSPGRVETVALPALEAAVRCSLVAVSLDRTVVRRADRQRLHGDQP